MLPARVPIHLGQRPHRRRPPPVQARGWLGASTWEITIQVGTTIQVLRTNLGGPFFLIPLRSTPSTGVIMTIRVIMTQKAKIIQDEHLF